jgi:toxin CcdB
MAQFDVYENPNHETNQAVPYLLDIQADLLDNLTTRVVAPLVNASVVGKPIPHLNPRFNIESTAVFMSAAELAGIPIRALGKKIGSLKEQRNEIIAALDFLITGF